MLTLTRSLAARGSVALALSLAACSGTRGSRAEGAPIATPASGSASSPARTEPRSPPRTEPRSPPRTELRPLARDALVEPMRAHGDNLESLLWTTLMLDHESTATIASWIAEEPRVSRPGQALDSLNASFPPAFFDLQDQLYTSAEQLARAARERNDGAMADAFSRLAGTCIRCHSAYLPSTLRARER